MEPGDAFFQNSGGRAVQEQAKTGNQAAQDVQILPGAAAGEEAQASQHDKQADSHHHAGAVARHRFVGGRSVVTKDIFELKNMIVHQSGNQNHQQVAEHGRRKHPK